MIIDFDSFEDLNKSLKALFMKSFVIKSLKRSNPSKVRAFLGNSKANEAKSKVERVRFKKS